MSSDSPKSEQLDTRFSTPIPELDDHRQGLLIPRDTEATSREVLQPIPRQSSIDANALLKISDALREAGPVSRDFEQVIVDDDRSDRADILNVEARRGSNKPRRHTNRQGRPQIAIDRVDRSRESSSSRSTSTQNSVEAFAGPRRRDRANTLESRAASFSEVVHHRKPSIETAPRRPSLSNISRGKPGTHPADDVYLNDDDGFPIYEEPGKTYKIDYEELEEYVALCARGLIPDAAPHGRKQGVSGDAKSPKIFYDLRTNKRKPDTPRIVMNGENPHELPLEQFESIGSPTLHANEYDEKASLRTLVPRKERFCLFSSETQSVIYATELGDFTSDGTTFRDLFELGLDGGVWWLDVQNPTNSELEVFRKAFKLHPLTKEDIEQQEAREKVELFSQYYFVSFRSFHNDQSSEEFLEAVNIYIVVCAEGVLSFTYSDTPHANNVRKRINKTRDFVNLGPDYICYALIDDIVDSFAPVIQCAEQESENIEDQVFITRDDDHVHLLKQIGECRKRVLNMMRLLGGKADVIKGFAKRCNEQYSVTPRGDIGVYLGDIQDHVVTMMSTLGHIEKMLSRSHSNYLAQLNVDHLLRGNATNKVLSKITVLATILVPLNLICGLFGMNVPVPGRETTGLEWFFGIVGVIAGVVAVSIVVARRLRVI